jgi:hypothetical protein
MGTNNNTTTTHNNIEIVRAKFSVSRAVVPNNNNSYHPNMLTIQTIVSYKLLGDPNNIHTRIATCNRTFHGLVEFGRRRQCPIPSLLRFFPRSLLGRWLSLLANDQGYQVVLDYLGVDESLHGEQQVVQVFERKLRDDELVALLAN